MKKRNFDNLKRSNETITERSKRLENMRKFDSSKRSNETIAERSTRLMKKRNLDNLKRSNETIAERSTRLKKKRNFDNLKRSNETITERSKRLENMRKFDSLKRSNETIAERSTRLMKKRNFDNLKRSNETAIERLERLQKKRKCDNYRRSNETVVTRQLRLSRLRKYLKLAQSRERTKKSRTLDTMMENRRITKKQESVSDKLLKLAKQRKLAKLIQFSKITVEKVPECSDLPIETNEIPESLGNIEGAFRDIEVTGTTGNQTLKRKDSEMFLTRSEEILSTDKCSQSMEVESNLMQNELNMLSMIPLSSVNNALNVNKFLTDIEAGPYYICKSCNMLYRKSVRKFHRDTYSIDIFTDVPSFDNEQYICNTCHLKLMKGKIPCQAVYNKLQMDQAPPELEELRKLESILVAERLVFQKIVVLPKGQQKKIKGAICNVPVNCETVCKSLPRPSEQSGVTLLKLKRKLKYSGHQYCEAVRPESLRRALEFLKENNHLYQNVEINMENIGEHPLHINKIKDSVKSIFEDLSDSKEKTTTSLRHDRNGVSGDGAVLTEKACDEEEEIDDPQNQYRVSVNETCLESYVPDYPIEVSSSSVTNSETNDNN